MARPTEDRGHYVHPDAPDTVIHCKKAKAVGLRPLSEEEVKALTAAKRRNRPAPAVQETTQAVASQHVDLSPLYEEIARLRQDVADQFAANTQATIDHLIRYMSEINIAMNALKSDAEAADDKVRMVRESCRQILGDRWQERAQDIVAQHDADAIRLMGAS